jgi:transposase-like protein
MQLQSETRLTGIRSFASPINCPYCGDLMVAPELSEFVVGGEIRHHWECESCGRSSSTSIHATVTSGWNRGNR